MFFEVRQYKARKDPTINHLKVVTARGIVLVNRLGEYNKRITNEQMCDVF